MNAVDTAGHYNISKSSQIFRCLVMQLLCIPLVPFGLGKGFTVKILQTTVASSFRL